MHNFVARTIKALIFIEYVIHLMVAAMLLLATGGIFVQSLQDWGNFTYPSILNLINNALLMLIIKEVLWTVIKFLKKQAFSISPFLFIGVISGIRQILFIEAQKSITKVHTIELTAELAVNALVILILITAYYVLKKADQSGLSKRRVHIVNLPGKKTNSQQS